MSIRINNVAGAVVLAGFMTAGIGLAQAETSRTITPVVAAKVEAAQATAETIAESPACSRKVKVVYAGYGEARRAECGGTPVVR